MIEPEDTTLRPAIAADQVPGPGQLSTSRPWHSQESSVPATERADGPSVPPPLASDPPCGALRARYLSRLGSPDPAERVVARHQLGLLNGGSHASRRREETEVLPAPGILRGMVEQVVGPLPAHDKKAPFDA